MRHASDLALPTSLTKALSLKQPFAWLIVIMLNFITSTIAFSIAAYALNRIFNTHAGWAVDKLDGDAELHKNDPSIIKIAQSGDPVKIAKPLAGFN